MAIPVLQDATIYRGVLTKAGWAAVAMSDLMLVSGTGITSWSMALTNGTSGDFTQPTDGTSPTPTAQGVANSLNGGPYVFSVTATNGDGASFGHTLTINIRASTFTISTRAELLLVNPSPAGDASAALINGRTVEFARCSTDFGLAKFASGNAGSNTGIILFKSWRCSGSNRCTVKHEDPSVPCDLGRFDIRSPKNIDFVSLRSNTAVRQLLGSIIEVGIQFSSGTPGATESVRMMDTYGPCGLDGPPIGSANEGLTVVGIQFGVATGAGCEVELQNFEIIRCCKGIVLGASTLAPYNLNFTGRTLIEAWTTNAWSIPDTHVDSTYHFDFLCLVAPGIDLGSPGTHPDGIQLLKASSGRGIDIDKLYFIRAYGIGCATQAVFSRAYSTDNGGVARPFNLTIRNAIICNNLLPGIVIAGANSANPSLTQNITIVRQCSGPWGYGNDTPVRFYPRYQLQADVLVGGLTADRIFAQGLVANVSPVTLPASVVSAGQANDITAWFPSSGPITSTALAASLTANTGVENYQGVDDPRWHQDTDSIIDFVKACLTPSVNGSARLSDGRYIGALFPDGTDNDGSVWNSTPPTTYTLAAPDTVEIGTAVPFTATLDKPANADTTITIAFSGVPGSASGNPIVIPVGQTSGTASFTPSDDGTLLGTATNDRSLTNPAAESVTVTSPVNPPTSYTLSGPSSLVRPGTATFTATLNNPATLTTTITIAFSGVTGVASGNPIVIAVGALSGQATFTPSATGSLTATPSDDRGLTDPAAVVVTVTDPAPDPNPTTYTLNAPATGTEGAALTVTATLDKPATATTLITLGFAGVAGSASGNPITIVTGDTSGQATYTPSATGTLTISGTNNRSLANPSNATVTIEAAAPTTFTQAATASVAVVSQVVSVFYTLDKPATAAVTITPAATGTLVGVFSAPTVVIPIGERTQSVTFQPSALGAGTLVATNNRSLANPVAVSLTVLNQTPANALLMHLRGT